MNATLRQFMVDKGYSQHVIDGGVVGYLLPVWEATVNAIETGYGDIAEEYLNDVGSRELIHECIDLLDVEERSQVIPRLESADRRFIASTVPIDKPLWGHMQEEHWWLFRAPSDMLEELNVKRCT